MQLFSRAGISLRLSNANISKFFSTMVALIMLSSVAPQAKAIEVTSETSGELREMELLDGLHNADKSYAYFNLTVTENDFTSGVEMPKANLALNVYATSFNSDPDIFVTKTGHVNRLLDATWHSTREGSDTCIIHADDYEIGDTLFITIFCMNECDYEIKPHYAEVYDLEDSERMVFRWGGHST